MHRHTECNWERSAPLFALGSLPQAEHDGFSAHLLDGCGRCGAALREARDGVARMDLARAAADVADGVDAPPGLRERVLGATAPDAPEPASTGELAGVTVLHGGDGTWSASPFEGIELRILSEDPESNVATLLVRMQPGAVFPAHRHTTREECFVLSGDLSFGAQRMNAGDYQVAEAHSFHPPHTTEGGCMLLLVASRDDLVAA